MRKTLLAATALAALPLAARAQQSTIHSLATQHTAVAGVDEIMVDRTNSGMTGRAASGRATAAQVVAGGLKPAQSGQLGGIIPGYGLSVDPNTGIATVTVTGGSSGPATATALGSVRVPVSGGLTIDGSGNLSVSLSLSMIQAALGYLPGSGNGTITGLTGDVTSTGIGQVNTTLNPVGTAGTYSKVTTDAKGRVVSGGTLASGDITGALGFTPISAAGAAAAAPVQTVNSASGNVVITATSLGALSTTGDASNVTVKATGSSTARTEAAREAQVFNVLDYGAVADGTTDLGIALNTIAGLMSSTSANEIFIPAGSYALKSQVTFTGVAPSIRGQGFTAGPGPTGSTGTWITISGSAFTGTAPAAPITITGTNARGAVIKDLAFTEVQPSTSASPWTPTSYDFVFRIQSTLGEVIFDNVLMSGVTNGIYCDNSGRLNIKNLNGQFFTNAVTIDDAYDIPRIEHLHSWTYWSSATSVMAWQQANLNTVTLKRVDGIFIGDLFTFDAYSGLYLTTGANGVTTKLYANSVYVDQSKYGALVDATAANGQIGKITTQHNDIVAGSGAIIAGSRGMLLTGATDWFQVGQWRTNSVNGPAIDLEGSGNRVTVEDFAANTYWTTAPGDGTPAVMVANSGTLAANFAEVRGTPFLQGVSPLILFNASTNGGRSRTVQMNSVDGGSPGNEVRCYDNTAGNPVTCAAIGSDSNITMQVQGKGTSGVNLQSGGQTVLRVDNANTSTNDVLLRGGNGSMNLVAEGGDANIDYYLTPKGTTGGVRLQGAGNTVLRVDNPNASVDDLLVRGGTGTINLLPEGAESAIDLYLGTKAAGSLRLQANNSTVFRIDNPNALADDILMRATSGALNLIAEGSDTNVDLVLSPKGSTGSVRLQSNSQTVARVTTTGTTDTTDLLLKSGVGTVALIAEDPGTLANIVLNPKGTGLVSTGNCPSGTDNASNLACTSTVVVRLQNAIPAGTVGQLFGPTGTAGSAGTITIGSGLVLSSNTLVATGGTGGSGGITSLTGDVTASGTGSVVATLASVGTAGTYGDGGHVDQIVTDAKGRVIVNAPIAISFPVTSVAGRGGAVTLAAADISGLGPYATQGSIASAGVLGTGSGGALQEQTGNTGYVLQGYGSGAHAAFGPIGPFLGTPTGACSLVGYSGSATTCTTALPSGTTATTPATGDNTTTVATTAFVQATRGVAYLTTATNTSIALPTGWNVVWFQAIGGGGGSACGIVTASGTAASGGGTGGASSRMDGQFLSSITGGSTLSITIGAAGTPCTASGTTAGSTGSTPTAGGNTIVAVGTGSRTSYGGGAGSNGQQAAASAGGGSGGLCAAGGNASGAVAGTGGGCGGTTGGAGTTGSASTAMNMGASGSGGTGSAGVAGGGGNGAGSGGTGAGIAATPVSLAGGNGGRPGPISVTTAAGGLATCTSSSQNGASGTAVSGTGSELTGGGGGGGASCSAAAGGNGGAATGFGASGGGGGAAEAGSIAGSGGASTGGAVLWGVY